METLAPATEKLVKHLGVPVVMAKIKGGYLTFPKWAKNMRRGRVEIEVEEILTAEDSKAMNAEEIKAFLEKKLAYDDFKWQEEKRIRYRGKRFAEGLEHILYICPVCKHEYTFTAKGNLLTCSHCGTEVKLNPYYEFEANNPLIPKNIRDWYLFQGDGSKECGEGKLYSGKPRLFETSRPRRQVFKKAGEGVTVLTEKV